MNDEPQETNPQAYNTRGIVFLVFFGLFIIASIIGVYITFKSDIPIQELNCNVTGHPEAKLSYFMNGSSQDIKCCYTMTDNYSVGHQVCEGLR